MTDYQKKQLEQQLWNVANQLRGKMHADEFRDYCLGFIFFKHLSELMHRHANGILHEDRIDYLDIDETSKEGQEMLDAVREDAVEQIGFFIKPSQLFASLAKRGEDPDEFILDDLTSVLRSIERSTMGTASEDDFEHLFEDLDLTSSKLGRTEAAKNALIAKVLTHLNKIDFCLGEADSDVLGDAYEYLIGQFASGAGKKAGEFYTPPAVSTILAKIVTTGKDRLKSVYDPTCGSGSLLLRVAREVESVGDYYGQEMNRTTYNLCRMNMILHKVHYRNFDIKQEDTLEHPQHRDRRFDAVVANPPFSAKWSANPLHLSDDRFSQYGKLAPASKADFAFVQHMLYQLDDGGVMAVILPHGVLFRGAAEGHIRKYLIQERNWLDAVIGLPANIFYGTGIPTCILVFKKCREYPNDILFVDASTCFEKGKNQNFLRPRDIDKIVATYRGRVVEEKFSHRASLEDIAGNDYNLNIPRYVDTFEEDEPMDLAAVTKMLVAVDNLRQTADQKIEVYCSQLGAKAPKGQNVQLLKTYKRGMMQKIFSREVRFKTDDGVEFPDWEEKRLGELAQMVTTKNIDKSVSRVLTNSATRGVVDQLDYFDKDIANAENIGSYYVVDDGDFVYNPRISVSAPVGPINKNKIGKGVMSPLYTVFRFKTDKNQFFEFFFASTSWHRYMYSVANYGARHDRMNITNHDFKNMPVLVPHPDEQQKIADFFSAIDAKIAAVAGQIERMEQFKKGLLQQMFV